MMKKKMSDKHKLIAYVLSTDAELNSQKNITQEEIGNLLGVSQSTIAQSNKETALRLQNSMLRKELSDTKRELRQLKGIEALSLPNDFDDEYQHKW